MEQRQSAKILAKLYIMIIGFDAKRAFHNRRGLGNYSRDLVRQLSNYFPKNRYILFNPSARNCVDFTYPTNTQMVIPTAPIYRLFPSLWRTFGLTSDIKQQQLDIYHGLSQELPFGIERTGVKTIVTMHDAIFMRYPQLYSASYRNIFIRKNRYACRIADRIIAISEQTKQDLIHYFDADESKIDVVYQGCNAIFRTRTTKEEQQQIAQKYDLPKHFILTVGAIERRKNTACLLEAMHYGKFDCLLVIIGQPTKYKAELDTLIEKYSLQSRVLYRHNVITSDLPAIYAMASVFAYPSVFEGFGIPILEALCTATPVIASTGTCFEEVGGASTLYVDPNNPQQWAQAINTVLTDNALREKMKADGLTFADKFSDATIADNIMAVYNKLK